jgi:hypothetical protein
MSEDSLGIAVGNAETIAQETSGVVASGPFAGTFTSGPVSVAGWLETQALRRNKLVISKNSRAYKDFMRGRSFFSGALIIF